MKLPRVLEPLKQLPHWVVWKYEKRSDDDDEPIKVPYQAKNIARRARSNDPHTWATYDEACAVASQADGIGFVLDGSGIGCIDLDGAINPEGNIRDWAVDIVEKAKAEKHYIETSISGKGLHVIGLADGDPIHTSWKMGPGKQKIEVWRNTPRFIVVTGKQRGECDELRDINDLLEYTLAKKPGKERDTSPSGIFNSKVWRLLGKGWSVDQIEAHMREHPDEYADTSVARYEEGGRLREEIERSASKRNNNQDALISALAKVTDPISFERGCKEAAQKLGVTLTAVREAVKKCRKEFAHAASVTPKPDIRELARSAKRIIACDDVLTLFADAISQFIAGEEKIVKLLYLAATSRLFPKTMHTAIKGTSSGGKTEIRTQVLKFFPPEEVISFTAMSERALLYMSSPFEHKILSMGEAVNGQEVEFQDYLLRELMSAGKLKYPVVQKVEGELVTTVIEKDGPVAFMVTTTRNKLNPENETRMLSLEVDDSEEQTEAVLQKVASIEGHGRRDQSFDFTAWHDYQRWLAAGDCEVEVPFADELAELIPPKAVRLRRDFGQVLCAIKAHALMHREYRERNEHGAIVANINKDYVVVRRLMAEILATSAEVKLRKQTLETITAVRKGQPTNDTRGVSVREVAKHLKLDRSAAYRRLRSALDSGFINNIESRSGRPGQYRTTIADEKEESRELREGSKMLPMAIDLREAFEHADEHRAYPHKTAHQI
jgi:DNA-binding MarR family transcriptional regulator